MNILHVKLSGDRVLQGRENGRLLTTRTSTTQPAFCLNKHDPGRRKSGNGELLSGEVKGQGLWTLGSRVHDALLSRYVARSLRPRMS